MTTADEITHLLDAAGRGDRGAWERLVDLVYPDLKRLAHSARQGGDRHTLNTTALVHECYLRLSQGRSPPRDRDHLKSLAVRIMRQVLVDHARGQLAQKRGGGEEHVPLNDQVGVDQREFVELIDIDTILRQLAETEPRQAQVFEHRFFGGLNDEDTASALGVSPRTVRRDWDAAREWMAQRLDI
jgi:RNA polymerase sigma factor (TIGR02999 family)